MCCPCCHAPAVYLPLSLAVLDLDPKRLGELLTAWTTDWAANNWKT